MTNLDVMVTILSEATGHPKLIVSQAVCAGFAASGQDIVKIGLLTELPEQKAQRLLHMLRQDYGAALRWLKPGQASYSQSQAKLTQVNT
jgi:hypothetical protein